MAKRISGSVGKGGKIKPAGNQRPGMNRLSGSVGANGQNGVQDVKLVQKLLNAHIHKIPPTRPLSVDGMMRPDTVAAITRFQRIVVRLPLPDGRIDVDGPTFAALAAGA